MAERPALERALIVAPHPSERLLHQLLRLRVASLRGTDDAERELRRRDRHPIVRAHGLTGLERVPLRLLEPSQADVAPLRAERCASQSRPRSLRPCSVRTHSSSSFSARARSPCANAAAGDLHRHRGFCRRVAEVRVEVPRGRVRDLGLGVVASLSSRVSRARDEASARPTMLPLLVGETAMRSTRGSASVELESVDVVRPRAPCVISSSWSLRPASRAASSAELRPALERVAVAEPRGDLRRDPARARSGSPAPRRRAPRRARSTSARAAYRIGPLARGRPRREP